MKRKVKKREHKLAITAIVISIISFFPSGWAIFLSHKANQIAYEALVQGERPNLVIKAVKFKDEDAYLTMSASNLDKNKALVKFKYNIQITNVGKGIAKDISLFPQTNIKNGFLKELPDEYMPPRGATLAPGDSFWMVPVISYLINSNEINSLRESIKKNDIGMYSKVICAYRSNMKPSINYTVTIAEMIHPKSVDFLGSEEN